MCAHAPISKFHNFIPVFDELEGHVEIVLFGVIQHLDKLDDIRMIEFL